MTEHESKVACERCGSTEVEMTNRRPDGVGYEYRSFRCRTCEHAFGLRFDTRFNVPQPLARNR